MTRRRLEGKAAGPKKCPIQGCGGYLDDIGLCQDGFGFPITTSCPFVCPMCGANLDWSGGCMSCKGATAPEDRLTWTFPGNEYEVQHAHWVKVGGPAKATPPDKMKACMRVMDKVWLGLSAELANKEIAGILGVAAEEDPPF